MRTTLFLLFNVFCFLQGARILVIPIPLASHMLYVNVLGEELKKNGHEVYTVAEDAYIGKVVQPWTRGLEVLSYRVEHHIVNTFQRNFEKSIVNGTSDFLFTNVLWRSLYSCRRMFADEAFMGNITNLKFDLAIVEQQPGVSCTYLLPHIFNIPHVSVFLFHQPFYMPGSATLPSFSDLQLPSLFFASEFLTQKSNPTDFKERLMQTAFNIFTKNWVHRPFALLTGIFPEVNDVTMIEHFRSKGMVSESIQRYQDLIAETQLFILVNSGLTLHNTKPLYPNMISVDGLTIEEPKPLPKEIEDLVQSTQNGVIVVSFGGTLQNVPLEIVTTLVNIFTKRNETVFVRFSGSLKGLNMPVPANVKFMAWLPLQDLLAHNKTKLLITHGGLHAIHEAIYHGVPMLCIPLFVDQFSNARNVQAKGYGLSVRLSELLSGKGVLKKLEEVMGNPSYMQITKRAGQIMRHQPMTARQTVAFWIEHVLRFGGEHLRPSSIHLTWWQYFCLDTLGFIAFVTVILLWIMYLMLKIVANYVLKCTGLFSHAKRD